MGALTAASSSLHKITPEDLSLANLSYATAWFGGRLYLSLLRHETRRRTDLRRVLRWDAASQRWERIYERIIADDYGATKLREARSEQNGSAPCSTEIIVTPDVCNAEEIQFVFNSPLGLYRMSLCEGETGIMEPRALQSASVASKHVGWQDHQGVVFAVVEESDGARNLVWSRSAAGAASWQPIASPDRKGRISALTVFDGSLVIAVDNEVRGFGLWKLSGQLEEGSFSWEPILTEGALRYSLNSNVCSMAVRDGILYIGAGISNSARVRKYDSNYHAGGFELLRCYEDGDWDIISGTPRFTSQGLKVPLAGNSADFGESLTPKLILFLAGSSGFFVGAESEMGVQVWASGDAEEWTPVWIDALLSYQTISIVAAHDTAAGPLIIAETSDYELKRSLNIWLGTPVS